MHGVHSSLTAANSRTRKTVALIALLGLFFVALRHRHHLGDADSIETAEGLEVLSVSVPMSPKIFSASVACEQQLQ